MTLITQLLVPSNAMSSDMSESSMQSNSMSHSVMMDNDCDDDNCCAEDSSHCISHCHVVANAFVLLSGSNLINNLFTSSKVDSTLWISTPASLGSQNPPPIA
ncbi:hypothetical protein [Shewanella phaeophyticola]|uniref:Uncharacterized protein n=1 Tax=Shewanella phaeophyticola TaxID=2978345 RepID=A0ABT2P603_9GAMM|nr:hypothetical protein [Shewanella sp. KJ10-1]MCT8988094.1 hypothetical protein [Shewanella sp. KJ10-1]